MKHETCDESERTFDLKKCVILSFVSYSFVCWLFLVQILNPNSASNSLVYILVFVLGFIPSVGKSIV